MGRRNRNQRRMRQLDQALWESTPSIMPQASAPAATTKHAQNLIVQDANESASSSQTPNRDSAIRAPQAKDQYLQMRDRCPRLTDVPDSSVSTTAGPQVKDSIGLLFLPQELLDMLFDLAYPQESDSGILIDRAEWYRNQRSEWLKDSTHVTQPFPQHKVNSFMASKKYFSNAAGAYFRNQCWDSRQKLSNIVSHFIIFQHGLFYQNLRKLVVTAHLTLESLKYCHGLTDLTVVFHESDFNNMTKKSMWQDVCGEHEFRDFELVSHLTACTSVKKLKLLADFNWYTKTPAKKRIWEENIARLEEFTNAARENIAPKIGHPSRTADHRRLYLGSRVALQGSTLLPEISPRFSSDPFGEPEIDDIPKVVVPDVGVGEVVEEEENIMPSSSAAEVEVSEIDLESAADVSREHTGSLDSTESGLVKKETELPFYRQLRHLTLELGDSSFEDMAPKSMWLDMCYEEDFKDLAIILMLLRCSTLQGLKLVPARELKVRMTAELRTWTQNATGLERYVMSSIQAAAKHAGLTDFDLETKTFGEQDNEEAEISSESSVISSQTLVAAGKDELEVEEQISCQLMPSKAQVALGSDPDRISTLPEMMQQEPTPRLTKSLLAMLTCCVLLCWLLGYGSCMARS